MTKDDLDELMTCIDRAQDEVIGAQDKLTELLGYLYVQVKQLIAENEDLESAVSSLEDSLMEELEAHPR